MWPSSKKESTTETRLGYLCQEQINCHDMFKSRQVCRTCQASRWSPLGGLFLCRTLSSCHLVQIFVHRSLSRQPHWPMTGMTISIKYFHDFFRLFHPLVAINLSFECASRCQASMAWWLNMEFRTTMVRNLELWSDQGHSGRRQEIGHDEPQHYTPQFKILCQTNKTYFSGENGSFSSLAYATETISHASGATAHRISIYQFQMASYELIVVQYHNVTWHNLVCSITSQRSSNAS